MKVQISEFSGNIRVPPKASCSGLADSGRADWPRGSLSVPCVEEKERRTSSQKESPVVDLP